jgi:hypothetical protein
MRNKILMALVFPLIAALATQAAAASEHHHPRTNGRAVAIEQLRNSNANAALGYTAVQPDVSAEAEGAMTSGIAGH